MTARDETAEHKGLIASRVVEALVKGRGDTIDDLAEAIGMKRSTLYNRINKGDWKFTELVAVAEELNEPFSSFIDGLGGRFAVASTRRRANGRSDRGDNGDTSDGRSSVTPGYSVFDALADNAASSLPVAA